jgi:hypothetical protein
VYQRNSSHKKGGLVRLLGVGIKSTAQGVGTCASVTFRPFRPLRRLRRPQLASVGQLCLEDDGEGASTSSSSSEL